MVGITAKTVTNNQTAIMADVIVAAVSPWSVAQMAVVTKSVISRMAFIFASSFVAAKSAIIVVSAVFDISTISAVIGTNDDTVLKLEPTNVHNSRFVMWFNLNLFLGLCLWSFYLSFSLMSVGAAMETAEARMTWVETVVAKERTGCTVVTTEETLVAAVKTLISAKVSLGAAMVNLTTTETIMNVEAGRGLCSSGGFDTFTVCSWPVMMSTIMRSLFDLLNF